MQRDLVKLKEQLTGEQFNSARQSTQMNIQSWLRACMFSLMRQLVHTVRFLVQMH